MRLSGGRGGYARGGSRDGRQRARVVACEFASSWLPARRGPARPAFYPRSDQGRALPRSRLSFLGERGTWISATRPVCGTDGTATRGSFHQWPAASGCQPPCAVFTLPVVPAPATPPSTELPARAPSRRPYSGSARPPTLLSSCARRTRAACPGPFGHVNVTWRGQLEGGGGAAWSSPCASQRTVTTSANTNADAGRRSATGPLGRSRGATVHVGGWGGAIGWAV